MFEYRCYFMRDDATYRAFGQETLGHETMHILQVDSDDMARSVAEAIATECDHIRGFELWQGTRCIQRRA
jgi:hypothetical protein